MIDDEAQYGQIAVSMCDSTSNVAPHDWQAISTWLELLEVVARGINASLGIASRKLLVEPS
jgi:hypothetical protein